MSDTIITEKAMRSVFVNNIPQDVSEEKMANIFSAAGNVLVFKKVIDKKSGKPKAYGFCEFKDASVAQKARNMFNLYKIGDRQLRLEIASSEPSMRELKAVIKLCLDDENNSKENIGLVVSSLPADHMYELLKQMKQCVEKNGTEAKQMLVQNPQLAYSLLQAQLAMKIVDPKVAKNILKRKSKVAAKDPKPMTNSLQNEINNILSRSSASVKKSSSAASKSVQPAPAKAQSSAQDEPKPSSSAAKASASTAGNAPASVTAKDSNNANISEKERADLIMEVMKLTPEQIALLAPEQRKSILELKGQIMQKMKMK